MMISHVPQNISAWLIDSTILGLPPKDPHEDDNEGEEDDGDDKEEEEASGHQRAG
jgi:uncharacterized metal-binding protein YceD (DUF177 family)